MKKLDSMSRSNALSILDSMIEYQEQYEKYGKAVNQYLNAYADLRLTESGREDRRKNWTLGTYMKKGFLTKIIRRTLISYALTWLIGVIIAGIFTVVNEAKALAAGEMSTGDISPMVAALLLLVMGIAFVFIWCFQWYRPCKKQQKEDNDSTITASNQKRLRELYDVLEKYQRTYEKIKSVLNDYYSTYYTKDRFKDANMLRLLRERYTHPSQTIQAAIAECEQELRERETAEHYRMMQDSIESEMQEMRESMESYAQKQLDEQRRANELDYQRNEYLRRIDDAHRYGN